MISLDCERRMMDRTCFEMQAIIELQALRPVLPGFSRYGISILESRHAESFSMEFTRYNFFEVMLVLEGSGRFVHSSTGHPVARHDLMVVPKGEVYRIEDRPEAPLAILCLCIRPKVEQADMWVKVLPSHFSVSRNSGLARELGARLRTILFEQKMSPNQWRTLKVSPLCFRKFPSAIPKTPRRRAA